jgi:PAS domain S-box-containing protein
MAMLDRTRVLTLIAQTTMLRLLQHEGARATLVRVLLLAATLVGYDLAFDPLHARFGSAAFLVALVPCIVGGLSLGVPGGLLAVVVAIVIDRNHALALGMTRDASWLASILLKAFFGLGPGVLVDHARRLRRAKEELEQEVTARAAAERQVAKSEELHRALVESLGEGVGLFDGDNRFLYANDAFAKILDTSPEHLVGAKLSLFVDGPSRDRMERFYQQPSRPRSYDVVLRAESKRLLLVTETALALGGKQQTLRVVRDLTERAASEKRQRQLERELERSQAFQSLAILAGGVAHDFNNLLSGVVGNAEYALLVLPQDAPSKVRRSLEEIKDFAGAASELSRQMLAYAGRRSLSVDPVAVNTEVGEALRLLRSTVEPKARMIVDLEDALPELNADRFQLRQVLTNLVLNAVEALGDKRGTVTISTSRHNLLREDIAQQGGPPNARAGAYVSVSVRDTGAGIAPEAIERIFQPFFSTKSQGRGMGLAAAAGIARSHGGWLAVDSSPGKGTCFSLWLPVPKEVVKSAPPPAPSLPPSPISGERASVRERGDNCVLLIDDEPAVRLVTGRLLEEMGQRVLTADCGTRGLELFREHQDEVDVVVLDLTMPDLSGKQVLGELRKMSPDVEVVITSGFQPNGSSELLSSPNVRSFLQKPHTLANLEALVGRQFVASNRPVVTPALGGTSNA